MNAYMYQYNCPGEWYGKYTGVRNFYTSLELKDNIVSDLAKKDVEHSLGRKKCDINLLVKYKLSIESVKTYPEITKIPFTEQPKNVKLGLD